MIAFTDGVVEAADPEEDQFGESRLEECATAASRQAPTEICARVLEAVSAFASTAPQFDDIALVVLRATGRVRKSGPEDVRELPLPGLV